MDFEKIDILELLPQQPPFIMVDKLISYSSQTTETALTVHKDNIFVENNIFTESGIIENIAQTCAARIGYMNKYIYKKPVNIGFIGSIKNLVITENPKTGDKLRTTIDVVSEVFAITLVNAKVESNGKIIASCEMKISLTDTAI